MTYSSWYSWERRNLNDEQKAAELAELRQRANRNLANIKAKSSTLVRCKGSNITS